MDNDLATARTNLETAPTTKNILAMIDALMDRLDTRAPIVHGYNSIRFKCACGTINLWGKHHLYGDVTIIAIRCMKCFQKHAKVRASFRGVVKRVEKD